MSADAIEHVDLLNEKVAKVLRAFFSNDARFGWFRHDDPASMGRTVWTLSMHGTVEMDEDHAQALNDVLGGLAPRPAD